MDDKTKYHKKLEEISHISMDEAKKLILDEARNEARADIAKIIRESEDEARVTASQKAREILADSLQHGALDIVPEFTVSVIKIQDEDVKGRIIGKEGRNIRAFETATGVDVGLDEEGIIRLSSFDSVRREIARRSLELLIKDTRIQPIRIEEVVAQQKKEITEILLEEGKNIAEEAGVLNIHPDLLATLGRFKFRSSFGQNLVVHSLEVSKIAAHLAAEIGANVEIARVGGLFHDIGKVVSDKEGSHVQLGVELLQKYKMPREVVNAVWEHHEDKPFSSVESILVYMADASSGGRPGARHEDVEEYVKRIRDMEQIAKGFEGVLDAYAFEAGRELRVVIDPGKMDDIETTIIAKKIKEDIDKKLIVPGVVRVTAIREFRTTEPKE
ncbi:MAG TPA: ribonuclease Y [Patescibacteria group bacterium]|nr:ribonuclease Y [Patescibacteria group bacterium]